MHELPLVFFTVLAQAVAGSFILLQALTLHPTYKQALESRTIIKVLLPLVILLGISGVAALTHLGTPVRAMNVLFGIAHLSAMSLEIIAVSTFGGVLTSVLLLAWRGQFGAIYAFARLIGVAAAFVMLGAIANVYHLDTVRLWSSGWTWFNFTISGFITGSLLLALLLRLANLCGESLLRSCWPILLIVSTVFGVNYLLDLSVQLFSQSALLPDWLTWLFTCRVGLLVTAFAVCIYQPAKSKLPFSLLTMATLMVVIAELIGRIFFYELLLINQL